MDDASLSVLARSRVFSSLPLDVLGKLLSSSLIRVLNQGEVLFQQGDISDNVYLLLEGKLITELMTFDGDQRTIGYIDQGEMVGELGVLASEARSLTARARKQSRLLQIPASYFIELCHQHPAVMFAVLHPIVVRSKNLLHLMSTSKSSKRTVILPANRHVSLQAFVQQLENHVDSMKGRLLLLSDYRPEFANYNASMDEVRETIRKMKERHPSVRRYLYVLKSHDTPLARYIFKKADKIYIAADAATSPNLDQHIIDKIKSRHAPAMEDPHLVLVHPDKTVQPTQTMRWLSLYPFGLHHHVRLNESSDYKRLIRFIRDKAVGVVLSGGGTRGWAHLGVIKAIRESHIPIDMIGGSSIGAVVAACYAINENEQDAYDRLRRIVVESRGTISWRSLTWPVASLFNAKRFTEAYQDAFADLRLENVWLPCFGISSNLALNQVRVHRTGNIWEILRASTAIPGLVPPMLLNGEMHVDGGLLNNFPVDIMRELLGKRSKIIGAELNTFSGHPHHYDFPPVLTAWDMLTFKLGLGRVKYVFPSFVDTFLQSLFAGSTAKSQQNSMAANIFVSLELGKFSMLKSNPEQAEQLIEIGYRETLNQIEQMSHQNKQQG